jgi:hypothetical protein
VGAVSLKKKIVEQTDTEVGRLDGDLLHESAETLARYLDKQNSYTSLQADALVRDGERVTPTPQASRSRSPSWTPSPIRQGSFLSRPHCALVTRRPAGCS